MNGTTQPPGIVVAAARSGAGKTTVALGLMRALSRRGLSVQPFKSGPDYIDPAFHAAATGRESFNLDTWCMRPDLLHNLIMHTSDGAGIVVAEGVMGLFDGAAGPGSAGHGSTADIAALTGWPVLLVLDVTGQTETAAAIALGCRTYRSDVAIAGVVLNRVASRRHADLIEPALRRSAIEPLGCLMRDNALSLPERHLGLVQAAEHAGLDSHLDRLADAMESGLDIDRILAGAKPARLAHDASGRPTTPPAPIVALQPPGQRIAVAHDSAFTFMYPHLLSSWSAAGAQILPFSPLADEAPSVQADAVWLPGGYPELHAGTLAAASRFRAGLRALAAKDVPIHGECGGYVVLGQGLQDADGQRHAMAGLLALETSFARPRLTLGYRRARLLATCPLGAAGNIVRGHEFHYIGVLATGSDLPLVAATDAAGNRVAECGSRRGSVTGTFFHALDDDAPRTGRLPGAGHRIDRDHMLPPRRPT